MPRTSDPDTILRGLATTLQRTRTIARALSPQQLVTPPEPGAWSANDILWHIRATADVYGEHITRILNEDEPRWRHASPRARMKKTRYNELPFAESFAAFEQQRSALLTLLDTIPSTAWERIAIVKVDYRPDEPWRLSLNERVTGMVHHEHIHCGEMEHLTRA